MYLRAVSYTHLCLFGPMNAGADRAIRSCAVVMGLFCDEKKRKEGDNNKGSTGKSGKDSLRLFIHNFPSFTKMICPSAACFPALAANSVEYRPQRIHFKPMVLQHVLSQMSDFAALYMEQLAAFFTFAVVAARRFAVILSADIFKTGAAASFDDVFCNHALLYHALQMTIHRRHSHCDAFLFEMVANIIDRNMATRDGFQKGK